MSNSKLENISFFDKATTTMKALGKQWGKAALEPYGNYLHITNEMLNKENTNYPKIAIHPIKQGAMTLVLGLYHLVKLPFVTIMHLASDLELLITQGCGQESAQEFLKTVNAFVIEALNAVSSIICGVLLVALSPILAGVHLIDAALYRSKPNNDACAPIENDDIEIMTLGNENELRQLGF